MGSFFCLWLVLWSGPKAKNQNIKKCAKNKRKSSLFRRKVWILWSCYPDLNWGPHPYQLIASPRSAAFRRFGGLFVPGSRRQSCFPLHCLRPLVSHCGSSCGSRTQFATWRTGLTRLNFIARSGVVSGQSSSNVIGMVLARSNSFNSSGVKANSFMISLIGSTAFAIINTSFKTGRQSCRNQPNNLSSCFVFVDYCSFRIYYKQNIVYPVSVP